MIAMITVKIYLQVSHVSSGFLIDDVLLSIGHPANLPRFETLKR